MHPALIQSNRYGLLSIRFVMLSLLGSYSTNVLNVCITLGQGAYLPNPSTYLSSAQIYDFVLRCSHNMILNA